MANSSNSNLCWASGVQRLSDDSLNRKKKAAHHSLVIGRTSWAHFKLIRALHLQSQTLDVKWMSKLALNLHFEISLQLCRLPHKRLSLLLTFRVGSNCCCSYHRKVRKICFFFLYCDCTTMFVPYHLIILL